MKPPTGSASEGASGGLYRGRFAPSPTGDLHAGSIMAALGSWLFARRAGGEWLVRIEDLDPPREVAGAARRQLRMLAAMGLVPDGPVEYQSARSAIYQQALDQLMERGRAFACHCSRSDLSAVGGIHRECVARRRRQNPAIRLRVPAGSRVTFVDRILGECTQDVSGTVGDFVLRRADGWWAYQLAVVVDDGAQRVTDVVRGADLLDSTPRQILLQRALGLPTPGYAHLPLILGLDGTKLSKSGAAPAVDPEDPVAALHAAWLALGQPLGAVPRGGTPQAFLEAASAAFDPALVPSNPQPAAVHNRGVTLHE